MNLYNCTCKWKLRLDHCIVLSSLIMKITAFIRFAITNINLIKYRVTCVEINQRKVYFNRFHFILLNCHLWSHKFTICNRCRLLDFKSHIAHGIFRSQKPYNTILKINHKLLVEFEVTKNHDKCLAFDFIDVMNAHALLSLNITCKDVFTPSFSSISC